MQNLYPIIRRVRRPLLVMDPPPVKGEAAAPHVAAPLEATATNGRQGWDRMEAASDTPGSTASSATPIVAPE